MEKKRISIVFVCLIGVGIISITACFPISSRIEQHEVVPRCSPPTGYFSEESVVGTWVAGSSEHMDTLIIRADGTYKQIVHVEFSQLPPLDYESAWLPWYLEYSKNEIPYLHLIGMAFCGMNPDIPCEKRDGGGYDFCQDRYLSMNGEGILIVLETSEENYTYLHYPLGSENSYLFGYQGP